VPTFSASPTGHTGLELLATAALTGNPPEKHGAATVAALSHPEQALLSAPGPYNPAAAVSGKVVKRILDLEFVEMSEITSDGDIQVAGRSGGPARPPITAISQWLERYAVMAAVLATRFPEKAPELFAYQASIIRAERNYEGKQWVVYDRQFRREALAKKDLNWLTPNLCLYNEAFTGRARPIPRCSYCLQEDHSAAMCPRNPSRPPSWNEAVWQSQFAMPTVPQAASDICRNYNDGRCRKSNCRYWHACTICQDTHPATTCPRRRQPFPRRPRSRSPFHRQSGGRV